MSERMNFKKYGFIRTPEEDFSDDGNRFTCYDYKGFRISYLKDSYGEVYLSLHNPREEYSDLDYFFDEVYEAYHKIGAVCDEYNGESNMTNEKLSLWAQDLDQLIKDCEEFDKLVENLKATKSINIYKLGDMHFTIIRDENTYGRDRITRLVTWDTNDWRIKRCAQLGFKIKECILDTKEEKELELILK